LIERGPSAIAGLDRCRDLQKSRIVAHAGDRRDIADRELTPALSFATLLGLASPLNKARSLLVSRARTRAINGDERPATI
jgi:hypothetical protein